MRWAIAGHNRRRPDGNRQQLPPSIWAPAWHENVPAGGRARLNDVVSPKSHTRSRPSHTYVHTGRVVAVPPHLSCAGMNTFRFVGEVINNHLLPVTEVWQLLGAAQLRQTTATTVRWGDDRAANRAAPGPPGIRPGGQLLNHSIVK